jgi:hypothetical protein
MSSPSNGPRQRRPIGAHSASAGGSSYATMTATSSSANMAAAAAAASAAENAAELSFGAEFGSDIQILSNAQVAVILQMSAQNALVRDEELNDVYKKTQKYVERFNTMKNKEKEHQELVDELDNLQKLVTQSFFAACVDSFAFFFFFIRCVRRSSPERLSSRGSRSRPSNHRAETCPCSRIARPARNKRTNERLIDASSAIPNKIVSPRTHS